MPILVFKKLFPYNKLPALDIVVVEMAPPLFTVTSALFER